MYSKNRKNVKAILSMLDAIEYLENDLVDDCRNLSEGKKEPEIRRYFSLSEAGKGLQIVSEYLIHKKKDLIVLLEDL